MSGGTLTPRRLPAPILAAALLQTFESGMCLVSGMVAVLASYTASAPVNGELRTAGLCLLLLCICLCVTLRRTVLTAPRLHLAPIGLHIVLAGMAVATGVRALPTWPATLAAWLVALGAMAVTFLLVPGPAPRTGARPR
jgi:hypothetical protein